MAATRTASRACEIFTTLEYGPAPESHACALVRACLDPRCLSPFAVFRAQFCSRTPVIHRGSSAAPPPRLPPLRRIQAGGRSLGPSRLLSLCRFVCSRESSCLFCSTPQDSVYRFSYSSESIQWVLWFFRVPSEPPVIPADSEFL